MRCFDDNDSYAKRTVVWKDGVFEEIENDDLLAYIVEAAGSLLVHLLDGQPAEASLAGRWLCCASPNNRWFATHSSDTRHQVLCMPLWTTDEFLHAANALGRDDLLEPELPIDSDDESSEGSEDGEDDEVEDGEDAMGSEQDDVDVMEDEEEVVDIVKEQGGDAEEGVDSVEDERGDADVEKDEGASEHTVADIWSLRDDESDETYEPPKQQQQALYGHVESDEEVQECIRSYRTCDAKPGSKTR